ncbi:hypothetical protein M378DRAFT_168145 [Amanita muscaria Koide BX008]|uniref:Uncharacterized protein n=1 Tax=Amanita muscaria (strain Koide BX008) TaxID=946122 RepID=A0A0C2T1S4_AMAMK|nr:hypothetical protein M378DRAFT_168145 [Amanita muscaria Koide BX008]
MSPTVFHNTIWYSGRQGLSLLGYPGLVDLHHRKDGVEEGIGMEADNQQVGIIHCHLAKEMRALNALNTCEQ